MGVPGCPELAFWTASIASPRMTLMARRSSSSDTTGVVATGSAVMPLLRCAQGRPTFSRVGVPEMTSSEQREAGREPVQEVSTAHRADLARTERARQRDRPEQRLDQPSVVVRDAEQMAAPSVAREEERGVGGGAGQQLPQ